MVIRCTAYSTVSASTIIASTAFDNSLHIVLSFSTSVILCLTCGNHPSRAKTTRTKSICSTSSPSLKEQLGGTVSQTCNWYRYKNERLNAESPQGNKTERRISCEDCSRYAGLHVFLAPSLFYLKRGSSNSKKTSNDWLMYFHLRFFLLSILPVLTNPILLQFSTRGCPQCA